ncbi:mCG1037450, partial [Mus musculus]
RYANHKTDSDIPLPTRFCFLGSKSAHSKKVTLTIAGTRYATVLLLGALGNCFEK